MPEMKNLAYYENLKYPIEILEDDDAYVASIPDLPGCVSYGDTLQATVDSLQSVKKLWIEGRLVAGLSIPEPAELDEYSGKFVLRIARGLHKSLQAEARRQGVSLNQYIGQILAERHKLIDLEETVRDAVKKCFTPRSVSCRSVWSEWHEHEPAYCFSPEDTVSVSGGGFREAFAALIGEKQRKSYELVLTSDPQIKFYRTTDAQKKAKAHTHHG